MEQESTGTPGCIYIYILVYIYIIIANTVFGGYHTLAFDTKYMMPLGVMLLYVAVIARQAPDV